MMSGVRCGETFEKENYASQVLAGTEFEHCTFSDCDFSYTDLSGVFFTDCVFKTCRFVVCELRSAHMQNVKFGNCRLSGLDFGKCAALGFSVEFSSSVLDNCVFRERKMAKTQFSRTELRNCFFSQSDLCGASFDECRLPETVFERCLLVGADFRTATDFNIDPGQNTIRKAKFSTYNLAGLLTAFGIVIE